MATRFRRASERAEPRRVHPDRAAYDRGAAQRERDRRKGIAPSCTASERCYGAPVYDGLCGIHFRIRAQEN